MTDGALFRKLARDLAEGSIVTDALAQFLAQVIREIHETRIAPAEARASALEGEVERLKAVNRAFQRGLELVDNPPITDQGRRPPIVRGSAPAKETP